MQLAAKLATPKHAALHHSKIAPKEMIPGAWRNIEVPETEDECAALIDECKARRVEMLRRLVGVSTIHRAKKMIRAYSRSESARVATLALVADKRGETIAPKPLWTARKIVEAGRKMSLEAVVPNQRVWVQPSEGGVPESRPVFQFTTWDAARQTLAHDALKAAIQLPKWMFQYNGGEAAAKRWVKARLPQARLVLVTDFPKNFLLLPWQLAEDGLPLSRRATEALLFEPWKRARARGFGLETAKPKWGPLFLGNIQMGDHEGVGHAGLNHCACEIGAGRGYPPGSVLASFAAQVVLQLILESVPELHVDGVEIGLISDNLIIILNDKALEGPVRNGLAAMALKYFDAAVTHQFCKRTITHDPKKFFRYIGRLLRKHKGDTQVLALPEHCDRIIMRVLNDHAAAKTHDDLRKAVRRLKGFLVHHGASPNAVDAVLRATLYTGAFAEQLPNKPIGWDAGDLVEDEGKTS